MRNRRVLKKERKELVIEYCRRITFAIDRDVDIVNVDQADVVKAQTPSMAWGPIGVTPLMIDTSHRPDRYTLLLDVSSKGRFLGQMIKGSCTGSVFIRF